MDGRMKHRDEIHENAVREYDGVVHYVEAYDVATDVFQYIAWRVKDQEPNYFQIHPMDCREMRETHQQRLNTLLERVKHHKKP